MALPVNVLRAQSSFEWVLAENKPNELNIVFNCFGLRDGHLLFTGATGLPTLPTPPSGNISPTLYLTDAKGNLLLKKNISRVSNCWLQYTNNLFETTDDSLILIGDGLRETDSLPTVVFLKLGYDLEIGTCKTYTIYPKDTVSQPQYYSTYRGLGGGTWKKHPNGGYYGINNILSYSKSSPWNIAAPILMACMRLDDDGDLRSFAKVKTRYLYDRRSNLEYSSTLNQYVSIDIAGETYWLDSSFQLISFDTSKWLPPEPPEYMQLKGTNSILPLNGHHLLVGGQSKSVKLPDQSWSFDDNLNLTILNDSFQTIKRILLKPDTTETVGNALTKVTPEFQAFDYISPDTIYFACVTNPVWDSVKYTVCQTDSNFKVRWYHNITLPGLSDLQSVKALPKGGCVLIGSVNGEDIFISMYNELGWLTTVPDHFLSPVYIHAFPNPATGIITLQTNLRGMNVDVYDTQGKLVMRSQTNSLNVSSLSNGLYFFVLRTPVGEMEWGKFVKHTAERN
jgi:hypothetical protein